MKELVITCDKCGKDIRVQNDRKASAIQRYTVTVSVSGVAVDGTYQGHFKGEPCISLDFCEECWGKFRAGICDKGLMEVRWFHTVKHIYADDQNYIRRVFGRKKDD